MLSFKNTRFIHSYLHVQKHRFVLILTMITTSISSSFRHLAREGSNLLLDPYGKQETKLKLI